MRGNMSYDSERDIVKSAQLIIDNYADRGIQRKRKKNKNENMSWFICGAVMASTIFIALIIKIY